MTSLYIVFNDSVTSDFIVTESRITYGVSTNLSTGQVNAIGTCPTTALTKDFYSGVSFPQILLPDVSDNIKTLYIQAGGSSLQAGGGGTINYGYVLGSDDSQIGNSFGVCYNYNTGNFSNKFGENGGTSYTEITAVSHSSLLPFKVYLKSQ